MPVAAPVLVKRYGDDSTGEMTRVHVLGLGGCMFASSRPWGVGTPLHLLMTLHSGVVRSTACVVYELEHAERGMDVGVEFVQVDPADRAALEAVTPVPPEGTY